MVSETNGATLARPALPSPSGRRWRRATDEGVLLKHRRTFPHPPSGHLLPEGEGTFRSGSQAAHHHTGLDAPTPDHVQGRLSPVKREALRQVARDASAMAQFESLRQCHWAATWFLDAVLEFKQIVTLAALLPPIARLPGFAADDPPMGDSLARHPEEIVPMRTESCRARWGWV